MATAFGMGSFLLRMLISCSLSASALAAYASTEVAPKPHVLFILVDDLGHANVGFNRDAQDSTKEVQTPNLDQMVKDGIHLTRHYVHQYCTPTRTSVQSGRLPVHVNTGLGDPCSDNTGISRNMSGIAEKLKLAGYTSGMAGKWDAGMATPQHTPQGRGYDTSLNYFSHKNDFWSQANMQTCCESDQTIIDFWHTDKGASDVNSTGYSEFLYATELTNVVKAHDPSTPLFLFYAPHVAHCPLQVPKTYYDKFGFMTNDEGECAKQTVKGVHTIDPHYPDLEYKCRQQYHAMVNIMDDAVGNITNAIKTKGMWNNTLVIMSSDNGGPIDLQENAANNWPLRGGKYSLFEGGIRVAAFASGGFIPQHLRGTVNNGIVHIADWYSTLSGLAGVDPTDHRAAASGLPPIDSIDMWPFLSGAVTNSPRAVLPIGPSCLIVGDWKIITSASSPSTYQSPMFPNASSVEIQQSQPHEHGQQQLLVADWYTNTHTNVNRDGETASTPPPRPFPKLAQCYTGTNTTLLQQQAWVMPPMLNKFGPVCDSSSPSSSPCWNVQNSQSRLILWGESTTPNAMFSLSSAGTLVSSINKDACIGAAGAGSELMMLTSEQCDGKSSDYITHGFAVNPTTSQIHVTASDGSLLCVTADMNGTAPTPSKGGMCSDGCLFNVVDDPTEQNNQYATQGARVVNMTAQLKQLVKSFYSNDDKFTNDCPAGEQKCACWMAKNKYSGFMGPFAFTDTDVST